jgi:phosphomannomutase
VILGADGRKGYEAIRDAAAEGLRRAGCSVVDLGVAMTPTIGVAIDHDDADGGLVVTASHNPQEWNGLKCLVRDQVGGIGGEFVSACAPSAAVASEIIAGFDGAARASGSDGAGALSGVEMDSTGMHVGPVLESTGEGAFASIRAAGFNVVLDSVNGAGRDAGRVLIADALGCRLMHLGNDASGVFPHPPEPTRENLTGLCGAVRERRADIGFAQDPDADRLAIVDERGGYVGEEYTLALAAEALLGAGQGRGRPGSRTESEPILVANLSTSRMIDDIAARYGARVVRTAVGEANVVEAMKREKATGRDVVLGGEGNGGVIWPRVTYVRDSLSAMALVLALMARTGKKVSELVAGIPAYAIEKRKVEIRRKEDAGPAVEKIAAFCSGATDGRHGSPLGGEPWHVDRQDGVRVDWPARRAWLHVRASNTEPIMRLIAEAPTAAEARAILDEAGRVIGG